MLATTDDGRSVESHSQLRQARRVLVALVLAATFLSLSASAQIESEISSRGFKPDKVYATGDIDTVNLFNGNLTLTIPIGSTYPITGAFSYGLTLSYNSGVWDYENVQIGQDIFLKGIPTPVSNAGLGWLLTLGELIPPYTPPINYSANFIYVSPDGARHSFADTLHNVDTADQGVWYTRDNSYLRLKEVNPTRMTVEHGDGTVHTLDDFGSVGNPDWRVTSIQDQYTNELSVSYVGDDWVITDPHGRTHYVYFQTFSGDLETPQLDRIVLEAFDNSTAEYVFTYYPDVVVDRGCRDTLPSSVPGHTELATVPMLKRIQMPHSEAYVIPSRTHSPTTR